MEYNSPRVGIGGKIRKSRSRLSIGRFYPASWTDPDLSITRITLSLSPRLSRSHSFATEGTRAIFPSRQKEPAPCFLRSLLIFMYIFFLFLSSTSVQRGSNIKISKLFVENIRIYTCLYLILIDILIFPKLLQESFFVYRCV